MPDELLSFSGDPYFFDEEKKVATPPINPDFFFLSVDSGFCYYFLRGPSPVSLPRVNPFTPADAT